MHQGPGCGLSSLTFLNLPEWQGTVTKCWRILADPLILPSAEKQCVDISREGSRQKENGRRDFARITRRVAK